MRGSSSTSSGVGQLDAAFLKLALRPRREEILEALARSEFARGEHMELAVTGIPRVKTVALYAWPEPLGRSRCVTVDVVRVGDRVLVSPATFELELGAKERPVQKDEMPPVVVTLAEAREGSTEDDDTVRVEGPEGVIEWRRVGAGTQREVQRLDASGVPVLADVNTEVYCYRMSCPKCGRVRYAKKNSLHQVWLCRVCTRGKRLRRRALSQYRARHGQ
jgi:hypothetical protein